MQNRLYSRLLYSVVLCLLFVSFLAVLGHADISTHSFNSGMNCYGVWKLPDTGQTYSYTGTFGEDHDYTPAATQPSYTVLNPVGISSVTVDNVTGLMWITNPTTDAAMGGTYYWEAALSACEGKTYAGYTDWRLPNIRELESIVTYEPSLSPRINATAFPGTRGNRYYSSTTGAPNSGNAWVVDFGGVLILSITKTVYACYVRCVRGGG